MSLNSSQFKLPGERVCIPRWVFGEKYIVRLEVEAVIPDAEPSEPCLEPATLHYLDQVQQWINLGNVEQLENAGLLYTRRSA